VSGTFRVDESRWPIAVCTLEGDLDETQLDAYVTEGTRLLERGEPYVVIIDVSRLGQASAYARARHKEWSDTNREKLRTRCLGSAFIMTSPLLRFITMTAMLVSPSPMPYAVCESVDEALEWAKGRLAAAAQQRG